MPATPQPPYHRWGIRFTSDPDRDVEYLQVLHDNDPSAAYRGELFLNEALDELYYTDSTGVIRRFGDRTTAPIPFSRVNFSSVRTFANDLAASADPTPVPVGGIYKTPDGFLKIRLV